MKINAFVWCFVALMTVAVSADDDLPPWMNDLNVLAADVMEGRETGSKGAQRSRDYLLKRYQQIGLSALPTLNDFTHPFTATKNDHVITGINMLGMLNANPGDGTAEPANRYIVVSAHYDHIGRSGRRIYNGADDNASGVAAMLYLATQSQQQQRQCHQVFLASDAEEHGLLGARAFVRAELINKAGIFVNLNLDMLSQPGGRREVLVSGNKSHPAFEQLISDIEFASTMPMIATDERSRVGRYPSNVDRRKVSDHAAFAEQGVPFLFLGVGRHTYYHTPRDTSSRVNQAFYAETVNVAWQYLQKLDALCGKSAD
ncbi:M28 family peptidase [Alteromonas gilva]|uniref:M28 family peptidase n=1 Tax=Alteromonas gilva TaxID=2987522 RepID=A0ABT5L744_9ALTE|nr:M28 family peptidase [Alteromonas gilva]MDC8832239.1 M28 family peptidase [Alteromonas gilva]